MSFQSQTRLVITRAWAGTKGIPGSLLGMPVPQGTYLPIRV